MNRQMKTVMTPPVRGSRMKVANAFFRLTAGEPMMSHAYGHENGGAIFIKRSCPAGAGARSGGHHGRR